MSASSAPSPWEILNDYTKTVAAVAAAFLAFTGTFSTTDRLAAAPVWPLMWCWSLLVIAIASALLSVAELTNFLRGGTRGSRNLCLLAANISYVALFLAAVFFMIFARYAVKNKQLGSPGTHHEEAQIFDASGQLPPFLPGSANDVSGNLVEAVCVSRQTLQDHSSPSAIVIGRNDRRELTRAAAMGRIGSNAGLAQQRAEKISEMLRDQNLCKANPLKGVMVAIGGPRNTNLASYRSPVERELALAADRRVEVEGLQVVQTSQGLPESAK